MESRNPPNLIKSINVIKLNLNFEASRLLLKETLEDKLLDIGLNIEVINAAIDTLSYSISLADFDEQNLTPPKLVQLSALLNISPNVLYDDYYQFIFSNYSHTILNFRAKNNLSQKRLSQILNVSPIHVLAWESLKTYPNRSQFYRLSKLLKEENFIDNS